MPAHTASVLRLGSSPPALRTLTLNEAAAFLHMHPEEVRIRAKRGLIPGAKAGRRWIFLEIDLVEFMRSLYAVRRRAASDLTGGCMSLIKRKKSSVWWIDFPKRRANTTIY